MNNSGGSNKASPATGGGFYINDLSSDMQNLRKVQMKYDALLARLMEGLEQHAAKRQSDYRECEELARCTGRMSRYLITQKRFSKFDTTKEK